MSTYLPTLVPKPSQHGQREHSIIASERGSKNWPSFFALPKQPVLSERKCQFISRFIRQSITRRNLPPLRSPSLLKNCASCWKLQYTEHTELAFSTSVSVYFCTTCFAGWHGWKFGMHQSCPRPPPPSAASFPITIIIIIIRTFARVVRCRVRGHFTPHRKPLHRDIRALPRSNSNWSLPPVWLGPRPQMPMFGMKGWLRAADLPDA